MNQPEAANTLSAAAETWMPGVRRPLEPPDSVLELHLAAERHEASFPRAIKAMWLGRPDWRPSLPPAVTAMYASLPAATPGLRENPWADRRVVLRRPAGRGRAQPCAVRRWGRPSGLAIPRWRSRGWRGGPGSSSNRPARWAPTIGLRPTTGFRFARDRLVGQLPG